jgi:hypothetical protein
MCLWPRAPGLAITRTRFADHTPGWVVSAVKTSVSAANAKVSRTDRRRAGGQTFSSQRAALVVVLMASASPPIRTVPSPVWFGDLTFTGTGRSILALMTNERVSHATLGSDVEQTRVDLAVVGSGGAAFAAAIRALTLGKSVAMIERAAVGGTCVNTGCVPSKALLVAA